jgi:hypothetical protein
MILNRRTSFNEGNIYALEYIGYQYGGAGGQKGVKFVKNVRHIPLNPVEGGSFRGV